MVPILTRDTLDFISRSTAQTERIGMRLAQFLRPGDVICLAGALGAGKTCLVRGIGRGLGVQGDVTSPTFVLVREHPVPGTDLYLYHIDLYRITSPQEALALGMEEYLYGNGICAIEWPERAQEVLPPERLWITLDHIGENQRTVTITAMGARYRELLAQLKKNAFGLGGL